MTMSNGVYGPFLRDAINNNKAFDLNATDTIKFVFVSSALTPAYDTMDEYADISANEVTGTGYTTGGETISTPTFTIASGFATFDGADVSLAGTTLTNVRGINTVDSSISGVPLLHSTDFAADYSTVAGPFAITWSVSGIWRVDYVP